MESTRSDTADLLALAVHEFRTPVTVVAGYLRMLARGQLGAMTDRQRTLVEDAERSCAKLTALISEMGDLSELEAGTLAIARDEVDLAALVDEVAAGAEEGRDRGVTITRDRDDGALLVEADRRRLRNAIAMLAAAVLREQSEPGTVTVHTSRVTRSGRLHAALGIGPGEAARIVLEENGPSARFKETRGGLGLALPIARRVIEQLGGRIWSPPTERPLGSVGVLIPLKENRS